MWGSLNGKINRKCLRHFPSLESFVVKLNIKKTDAVNTKSNQEFKSMLYQPRSQLHHPTPTKKQRLKKTNFQWRTHTSAQNMQSSKMYIVIK